MKSNQITHDSVVYKISFISKKLECAQLQFLGDGHFSMALLWQIATTIILFISMLLFKDM